MPGTAKQPTTTVEAEAAIEEAVALAAVMERREGQAEDDFNRRNVLFRKLYDLGVPAVEIGRIFGVQAQSVHWNLNERTDLRRAKRKKSLHRGGGTRTAQ